MAFNPDYLGGGFSAEFIDLSVSNNFDIGGVVASQFIVDGNNAEVFLVRKDGDAGDVLAVNTLVNQVLITADTNDGSTKPLVINDSDDVEIFNVNSNGDLTLGGSFSAPMSGIITGLLTVNQINDTQGIQINGSTLPASNFKLYVNNNGNSILETTGFLYTTGMGLLDDKVLNFGSSNDMYMKWNDSLGIWFFGKSSGGEASLITSDGTNMVMGSYDYTGTIGKVTIDGDTSDNTTYNQVWRNSSSGVLGVVRNDGRFGIGTTTPNQQFESVYTSPTLGSGEIVGAISGKIVPDGGDDGNSFIFSYGAELDNTATSDAETIAFGIQGDQFDHSVTAIDQDMIFDVLTTSGEGNAFYLEAGSAGAGGTLGGNIYISGGSGDTPADAGDTILAHNGDGSNGKVGIGTDSPTGNLDVAADDAYTSILARSASSDGSKYPIVAMYSARGTIDSPTAMQSEDQLGRLDFGGYGTTGYSGGKATIQAYSAENWSSTGRGSYMIFKTTNNGDANGSEKMRITNDGKVGIGTDSPDVPLEVVDETSGATRGIRSVNYSDSAASSNLELYKSRGSLSSPASVQNGDGVAFIPFVSRDTNGWLSSASIYALVNGAVSDNNVPVDITFRTSPASSAGGAERMRITSDGKVGIGTDSPNTQLHTTGGRSRHITTVNAATYDLLITDDILHVTYTATGAVTSLTLPTAQTTAGRTIVIKDAGGNASANSITVDTEGSETIDGSATAVISGDYDSITLYSDGSDWFIF